MDSVAFTLYFDHGRLGISLLPMSKEARQELGIALFIPRLLPLFNLPPAAEYRCIRRGRIADGPNTPGKLPTRAGNPRGPLHRMLRSERLPHALCGRLVEGSGHGPQRRALAHGRRAFNPAGRLASRPHRGESDGPASGRRGRRTAACHDPRHAETGHERRERRLPHRDLSPAPR